MDCNPQTTCNNRVMRGTGVYGKDKDRGEVFLSVEQVLQAEVHGNVEYLTRREFPSRGHF